MQDIPVLTAAGDSLAEAYENGLVALYRGGRPFRTQYDRPEDPPSLDATVNLTVRAPMRDPMIHKAFPGGIEDLREYVMELQGAKDHWAKNINDPQDTRWEYTYHGRLRAYGQWRELQEGGSVAAGPFAVDQVRRVVDKLAGQPFTRQAQMITWLPSLDLDCYDPPCLQSLWYRLCADDDGVLWLNANIRFRSNDAWGACFMNMFGLVMFNHDVIAAALARRLGQEVRIARLNWQADSFHIYGRDLPAAKARLFDRLASTAFEDRVFRFGDPMIREIYDEAEAAVREKIRAEDARQAERRAAAAVNPPG